MKKYGFCRLSLDLSIGMKKSRVIRLNNEKKEFETQYKMHTAYGRV